MSFNVNRVFADELDKHRPRTSHTSERFGLNFTPSSFALEQSIRLIYMLRAFPRSSQGATRATNDNEDAHTEHTLGNGDTTQQPARDSRRELAATAAATPPALLLLMLMLLMLVLMLLLCCSCCCAALVVLVAQACGGSG